MQTHMLVARAARRSLILAMVAAAFAIPFAIPAAAQGGGARARAQSRDTITVYRFGGARAMQTARMQAVLDSLMRRLNDEPLDPADRDRLGRRIDELVMALEGLVRAGSVPGGFAGSLDSVFTRHFDVTMDSAIAERLRSMRPLQGMKFTRSGDGDDPGSAVLRGWIGITAQGPQFTPRMRDGEMYIRYANYPEIISVEPSSPAKRAGIARGDVLVAYDGKDVVRESINLTRLLQPKRRLRVTVDRDGDRRDFNLTVQTAPEHLLERRVEFGLLEPQEAPVVAGVPTPAPAPRAGAVPRAPQVRAGTFRRSGGDAGEQPTMILVRERDDAVLGATVAAVDRDLGSNFGVSSGVLMVRVTEGSPAWATGLRTGDVVVRAGGRDVTSVRQLQRALVGRRDDGGVQVELVRKRRPLTITVRW